MDNRQIQFRDGFGNDGQPSLEHLQQLQALFALGAFWAQERRSEDLATALTHSKPVITVWDQDRLIGFARATSDGVYRATIWDVVIHPNYRGSGLGRKLVQTVLAHPHMSQVERIYLMTTHQQGFYQQIGFQTNTSTTMVLDQRHGSLSGLADIPTALPSNLRTQVSGVEVLLSNNGSSP